VILDLDRQTLKTRLLRQSLRDSPALEDAVFFEPKIKVMVSRPMFFHHEDGHSGTFDVQRQFLPSPSPIALVLVLVLVLGFLLFIWMEAFTVRRSRFAVSRFTRAVGKANRSAG
jgi:hypothetical protein